MAVANAVGSKLPMLVIEKAKTPRCFKNVKFLLCRYRNQQKGWIDGVLFEEYVRKMDKKFVSEGRKVALVIDNCPAHPQIENLKSIRLFFLPPNTTSQTQPTDQGVIHSLKAQYRKNVIRRIIRSVEKKKTLPKVPFLPGMQMLVAAWDAVATKTVLNCFRKSTVPSESQKFVITKDDDPFKELEEEIENLRSIQPDLVSENMEQLPFPRLM